MWHNKWLPWRLTTNVTYSMQEINCAWYRWWLLSFIQSFMPIDDGILIASFLGTKAYKTLKACPQPRLDYLPSVRFSPWMVMQTLREPPWLRCSFNHIPCEKFASQTPHRKKYRFSESLSVLVISVARTFHCSQSQIKWLGAYTKTLLQKWSFNFIAFFKDMLNHNIGDWSWWDIMNIFSPIINKFVKAVYYCEWSL